MITKNPSENILPVHLINLQNFLFQTLKFSIHEVMIEKESFEYNACQFICKQKKILFRRAKVTPKKIGFFVTLWKRNANGPIQPFSIKDPIDICIIEVIDTKKIGYFFFDKHVLNENGILSGKFKGKLGFRIYPIWTKPESKQAASTQKWQIPYFYEPNSNKNEWKSIALLFKS